MLLDKIIELAFKKHWKKMYVYWLIIENRIYSNIIILINPFKLAYACGRLSVIQGMSYLFENYPSLGY